MVSVQRVRAWLGPREGRWDFLYLCMAFQVSSGIGHNFEANRDYSSTKFVVRGTEEEASPEAKQEDWDAVLGSKAEFKAKMAKFGKEAEGGFKDFDAVKKYFLDKTKLNLAPSALEGLFAKDVRNAINTCQKEIGSVFDRIPEEAQVGCVDMAFGLGSFVNRPKPYRKFIEGIREGNWRAVAAESRRGGVGEQRNSDVYNLFMRVFAVEESRRKEEWDKIAYVWPSWEEIRQGPQRTDD